MTLMNDYVRALVPVNWRSNPSGWISGNCPMCVRNGQSRPDTKGRGGFHFDEGKFQYNCFNCNFKTGWSPQSRISVRLKQLLTALGADEADIQRMQLELLREQDVATLLIKTKKRKNLVIDWDEKELPEDAKPFMEFSEPNADWTVAATYLTDRGFDITDDRFMWSPSKKQGRVNKRFILPFTYKSKVVGYTARWAGDNIPAKMPKYYNQQPKSDFVYGLDRQTHNKEVVIVSEGQLDAIVTDGCAIGSNNINDDQADILHSLNKQIVILPDADEAGKLMCKAAIKHRWRVSFPEWKDAKDASDALTKYGRLYTIKSIINSAERNPTKIELLMRKYCK